MKTTKTITTTFMVPTLHIDRELLKNNNFLNGYCRDEITNEEYKDCIFLLFRPKQLDMFKEFLEGEYERTKNVIHDYDHKGGFVVVVYKLNEKFKKDFELIKQGKYSKTSPEFHEEFPKTVKIKNKTGELVDEFTIQYRVFKKKEDLIQYWEDKLDVTFSDDQEIWHGFEIDRETLTEKTLLLYERSQVI